MYGNPYILPQSNKLEVSSLGLHESRDIEIANIIAEEVEAQREITRLTYPDIPPKSPVKKGRKAVSGGLLSGGLLGDLDHAGYSYADTIPWESLFTFGICVFRCSKRAKMKVSEIIDFALNKCKPENLWVIFWYGEFFKIQGELDQAEVQNLLSAQHERKIKNIKEGGRAGGIKSGKKRRKDSRIPPAAALRAQIEEMKSASINPRGVVGIIARNLKVTPSAIYKRLKD